MIKLCLAVATVFFMTGCDKSSREYRKFVKENGGNSRLYCDERGFLHEERFLYVNAKKPMVYLINSNICEENLTFAQTHKK